MTNTTDNIEGVYKEKYKKIMRIVYFSCFIGILNLIIKLFDLKLTDNYSYHDQVWEVGVVKKLNLSQVQPEIKGLLQNMGLTDQNQVVLGVLAIKNKEDSWNERIFKNEKIENSLKPEAILNKVNKSN